MLMKSRNKTTSCNSAEYPFFILKSNLLEFTSKVIATPGGLIGIDNIIHIK